MPVPLRRLLPVLVLLVALAPAAEAVDWERHRDLETVEVVTTNEDGSERQTTVWLVVVDGQGYIRTGGTRWGGNVERDPEVTLLLGDERLDLRVEFVEDEATRERVVRAFREKYGFFDRVLGVFRGSHPKIMRLLPREAE